MSELRIDELINTFMRNVHRCIRRIEKLQTPSNNIWTPSEFYLSDGIFQYFWSFERSSPIYCLPSFFTLGLRCIWKVVVMFFFLLRESIEITRKKGRVAGYFTGNGWRTSPDCICYLLLIFSFKEERVDIFSFFFGKMSILFHGSNM